jgi:hypothetical protein
MEHNYVRECEFCTRMFAAGAARASGLIDRRKSQSVSGKRWAERERDWNRVDSVGSEETHVERNTSHARC